MPCEPIISGGKAVGFICSRSRGKPKPPPCYKCGKPSTRLCDHRAHGTQDTGKDAYGRGRSYQWAAIDTCDQPMCDECANRAGPDTDFCDFHNNEVARAGAAKAEAIHREQLRRLNRSDGEDGEQ